MAGKRTGKKIQASYKLDNRYMKNKKTKLERHLKRHPEDAQAKKSLGKIPEYRRKKPFNKVWSSITIKYAQQLKFIGCNGKEIKQIIFGK